MQEYTTFAQDYLWWWAQEIRRDLGLGGLVPGPGELYSKFRFG